MEIKVSLNVTAAMKLSRFIVENMAVELMAGADEAGEELNAEIRSFAPHESGVLQAVIGKYDSEYLEPGAVARAEDAVYSVHKVGAFTYEVVVGSNAEFVRYVNDGYTVGPNQFARFVDSGGGTVYTKLAAGKYYPGQYFFERGTQAAEKNVAAIFQKHVNAAFTEAHRNVARGATIQPARRRDARGRFVARNLPTQDTTHHK